MINFSCAPAYVNYIISNYAFLARLLYKYSFIIIDVTPLCLCKFKTITLKNNKFYLNSYVIIGTNYYLNMDEENYDNTTKSNRFDRKLVCITYPGIVENVDRMMTTLGGITKLENVRNE